jgi:hypothetical protein
MPMGSVACFSLSLALLLYTGYVNNHSYVSDHPSRHPTTVTVSMEHHHKT